MRQLIFWIKRKLILFPDRFRSGGEGYLRFCFGRSEEDINEAFTRLKIILTIHYEIYISNLSEIFGQNYS